MARFGFQPSEDDILRSKKVGRIFVADFQLGTGKYISIAEYSNENPPDIEIKISPRINLRVTYLTKEDKITGIQLSKVNGTKYESINFTTLDFEKILQLLELFSELDLKSIANKSIVLDESIIQDPKEILKFLNLIASDTHGREKLAEVVQNYGIIGVGDIENLAQKKEAVNFFEKILNSEEEFKQHKSYMGVGKDEEVWQRFFSENSWILGSNYVEILNERMLDVNNITDFLLKSYDGFVDIIELKLPSAPFWKDEEIPKSELTAAVMQCNRYILQTERKINDLEFNKKIDNTPIVKPRITLVYGRSENWTPDEEEAYRVLNSSYTNLTIMTYDHLLERSKRIIELSTPEENKAISDDVPIKYESDIKPEDLPF